MASNSLYYGDNLDILRRYVRDESVDLVYLDPPFKSDQTYNILFQEKDGSQSASQINAFEDTWYWDEQSIPVLRGSGRGWGQVAAAMRAFRHLLGANPIAAHCEAYSPWCSSTIRTARSRTSSEYLLGLPITPASQEMESPGNPGRFMTRIVT